VLNLSGTKFKGTRSFSSERLYVFLFLFFSNTLFAADYTPEPIEVYLKQSADAALWEKSCSTLTKKLIIRTGPWAFGFFSSFKCLPPSQTSTAKWQMQVDTRDGQMNLEIMLNKNTMAVTRIPANFKNLELLQDEDLSDAIAISLLDQLPALMRIGIYQPEFLVPTKAPLPPSKELVWGTLDYDDKTGKFSVNDLLSIDTSTNGGITKFLLAGSRPKKNWQSLWMFNQRGPKARAAEINAALLQVHEKLTKDLNTKTDDDQWQHFVTLRLGTSLYAEPAMLKNAKLVELSGEFRSGLLRGFVFDYRRVPKNIATVDGAQTYFGMDASRIGYRVAWNIQQSILYAVAVTPQIGFWTLDTSLPETTGNFTTAKEFSAKRELSMGLAASVELELSPSIRVQGILARNFSGPVFGTSTRLGVNTARYGADAYWLTGPSFGVRETPVSMFVHSFVFLESIRMDNKAVSESDRDSTSVETGFMGIGAGLRW